MKATAKAAAKKTTRKAASKATKKPRPDAYQIVTDALLAKLEAGVVAWRKPWHELGAPRNYVSKRLYSGINAFLLNMTGCVPYFVTFKQAKALGGSIRQGAKGYPVIFFKMLTKKEGSEATPSKPGEEEKVPLMQYYTVFSVEDVTGVDIVLPEVEAREHEPVEACEAVVANWAQKPVIKHMQQRAYYSPLLDYVNMPKPESFHTGAEYYSTLFHELTHATGHSQRLNREGITEAIKFGSQNYAREELIAEMGAAFLCAFTGIAPQAIDNSAAYLVSWLGKLNPDQKNAVKDSDAYRAFWVEKLKEDKKLVCQAASFAKKAAEYILGTGTEEEGEEATEQQAPAASRQEPTATAAEPVAAAEAVAEQEPADQVSAEFEAAERSWLAQGEQDEVGAEFEAAERSWLASGGDSAALIGQDQQVDLYTFRKGHLSSVPRDEHGQPDFNYLRREFTGVYPKMAAAIIRETPPQHSLEYVVVFAGTRQEVTAPLVAATQ